MGKPERERQREREREREGPLGRHRRRWGDNIQMDLLVVGWEHRLDLSGSE